MVGTDYSAVLEALLLSEAVGIAIFDRELRYERINRRLARYAPRTVEEYVGRTVDEALGPIRATVVRPLLEKARGGQATLGHLIDEETLQIVIDVVPIRVERVAVLVTETTERRRAEGALAMRLQLAELLSQLSAVFIDLPSDRVDEGVDKALAVAGATLDLDRVSLWRYDSGRLTLTATHEWTNSHTPGAPPGRKYVLPATGYLAPRLLDGEIVVVDSPDELPPEAMALRAVLEARGTRAVSFVPLMVAGDLRGAIVLSQLRSVREWPADLLPTLRLASDILANALERQSIDHGLRSQLAFEQAYRRLSTDLAAACDQDLFEVVEKGLSAIGQTLQLTRAAVAVFGKETSELREFRHWHSPGVAAFAPADFELSLQDARWPIATLMTGELVIASSSELSVEAAETYPFLGMDGIALHLLAPLRRAGTTVGAIVFQSLEEPSFGRLELAGRVGLLSELIGATLTRAEAEAEQGRTLEELRRLKNLVEDERDFLRQEVKGEPGRRELLGHSQALLRALEAVDAVATTNVTTLLLGESGVGKELFARALHERSRRANEALVKVNCASIPRELFESEFFGHVRGSFTGALKDRAGRFELAHRGTLFLDEVGEIPLELQSKLLRILQEGEFERVGEDRTRRVDVRIVAATNRNLARDVAAGTFRQDLYYRLSVFPIRIPPLRERRDDIELLANHFLALSRRALGRPGLELTREQLDALISYDWPGNVRELQHAIDRAVILSSTSQRLVVELDVHIAAPPAAAAPIMTAGDIQELSRHSVLAALERSSWRIAGKGGAAELLGLRPSTLRDRMRALGIEKQQR